MRPVLNFLSALLILASPLKLLRLYQSLNTSVRTEELVFQIDEAIAEEFKNKSRLLCWVMTSPKNHLSKGIHVRDTWGKRCNVLLFMTSKDDPALPTVALDVKEGRKYLWKKTEEALKHIYKHYGNAVDWILKADDDTLVFPENARYLLSRYNRDDPLLIGCKLKLRRTGTYLSGGAGYIFSREALKIYVEKALNGGEHCQSATSEAEDLRVAKCLENFGVRFVDTRDEKGLHRFLPLEPAFHLGPLTDEIKTGGGGWWWYTSYYKDNTFFGGDCCSSDPVTFHYVTPNEQHIFYNLAYNIRPFDVTFGDSLDGTPPPPPDNFLKDPKFSNEEANKLRKEAETRLVKDGWKKIRRQRNT